MKLRYVFFCLDDPAKPWYEDNETTLTTWKLLKSGVLRNFTSILRKERAYILLLPSAQQTNEKFNMYVEEMQHLFGRTHPNMTEEKKVGFLNRGVKESLFAGLVTIPLKNVLEFLQEASTNERTLNARTRHYNRPLQVNSNYPETMATTTG